MMEAGLAMAQTGRQAMETAAAAHTVVGKRSGLIGDALMAPHLGDYAELGRMAPAKMEAFARSGVAIARGWWDMQWSLLSEMQHVATFGLGGGAPTAGQWMAQVTRNTEFAIGTVERMAALGDKALAPVHKTATANAKRLSRPARKAG